MDKKKIVLIILFVLPITAYMFFSSAVNEFARLPILKKDLDISNTIKSDSVNLKDKITLLTFFGHDFETTKVYAFNMKEKIYDKNHEFKDFQVVTVISSDQEKYIDQFKYEINSTSSDAKFWKFVSLTDTEIKSVFEKLGSEIELSDKLSSDHCFIIDKNINLRGRLKDEDEGLKYAYDMSNIAEVNDKLNDDVKVLLAEYRLELKKYKEEQKED
ncbi:MAG: hypothetical protein ACTIKA_00795 [Psychroflexus halocasei]|uniref:hypothetical protein n=1 Tax=Psychroflexus sp. S27 TaxID=1982757 RepID=UPI000C2B006A|nr:hypothetical protein [Psychroflexus sp. S27]PJX22677.1 hypothetical protein CAP47_06510 [Psychroflexus sp. S27]